MLSIVELASNRPFRLDPVVGSGRIYSNAHPEGLAIGPSVWGEGALLGVEHLDGVLDPGYQYSLIVTFEVRITHLSG